MNLQIATANNCLLPRANTPIEFRPKCERVKSKVQRDQGAYHPSKLAGSASFLMSCLHPTMTKKLITETHFKGGCMQEVLSLAVLGNIFVLITWCLKKNITLHLITCNKVEYCEKLIRIQTTLL